MSCVAPNSAVANISPDRPPMSAVGVDRAELRDRRSSKTWLASSPATPAAEDGRPIAVDSGAQRNFHVYGSVREREEADRREIDALVAEPARHELDQHVQRQAGREAPGRCRSEAGVLTGTRTNGDSARGCGSTLSIRGDAKISRHGRRLSFPVVQVDDLVPEAPAAALELGRRSKRERIVAQIGGVAERRSCACCREQLARMARVVGPVRRDVQQPAGLEHARDFGHERAVARGGVCGGASSATGRGRTGSPRRS